ncbi:MAG: translation initiation factor eIF-2B [Candidatus Woesearchaeota archaeon]
MISRPAAGIKSVQGAEAVAKAGLEYVAQEVKSFKAAGRLALLAKLSRLRLVLESVRPTEPCMKNAIDYVFRHSSGDDIRELKESLLANVRFVAGSLRSSEEMVWEIGEKKISNGMVVFTHCHSSSVLGVLRLAKKNGKKFTVHNTETRPNFQGRKTAIELASLGIRVAHFVDSAARLALKKADIMLIGCDAFTSEAKIINKIGSELFCEAASKMQVPVYVCTTTWKYDPKTLFGYEELIEERRASEVWQNPPKNVIVDNHAFEKVDPRLVTGVITELGVFSPDALIEELRRCAWLS